jgi:hypothetical protein
VEFVAAGRPLASEQLAPLGDDEPVREPGHDVDERPHVLRRRIDPALADDLDHVVLLVPAPA